MAYLQVTPKRIKLGRNSVVNAQDLKLDGRQLDALGVLSGNRSPSPLRTDAHTTTPKKKSS